MKHQQKNGIRKANYLKIALLSTCLISFPAITLYAKSAYFVQTETYEGIQKSTLKQIFFYIEKNSNYIFIYQSSDVDLNQVVQLDRRIDLKRQSITEILDEIFTGTNVSYLIKDRQIIVRKTLQKKAPESSMAKEQPQGMIVNGTVKDNIGMPIIGANVSVKGTTAGVVTDKSGNFQLLDVNPNTTLQISFIGDKTIKTIAKKSMFLTMYEDNAVLNEVVVVGYGVQKKVNLSGAVDAVSSKIIDDRPILNVGQALQGAIPNLNIGIADGCANTTPTFNVRGFTSINGGDPLILVDNIPTTAIELMRLNPNDISAISVLKDASSAAIYGARAAYGVILITTKTGNSEKVSINVNANYSFRNVARLPEVIVDPYTVVTMKQNMGKPSYDPVFSDAWVALAKKHSDDPSLSPYETDPDDATKWAYFGRTNWLAELYKNNSPAYSVDVSISQKKERSSYILSAQYANQDGMLNYGNDTYVRYSLRGKMDFQVLNWLNIGNNTTFSDNTYDQAACSGNSYDDMFYNVAHNHSILVPKNPDGTWTTDPQGRLTGGRSFAILQDGGRINTMNRDFTTQFTMDMDLIKGVWNVKADATFRRDSQFGKESILPYTYRKGPNLAITTNSTIPTAVRNGTYTNYDVYNIYTNYQQTFAGKHFINGILGFNQESYYTDYAYSQRTTLISTSYPTSQLATGSMSMGEGINSWSLRGAFARLNYIYNNRYIVEFNGRYDGSSRFPKNDRFGFFPSASAAWVLSDEKFMQQVNKATDLSYLKLRASYGKLGNQNVSAYSYIPTMSSYQSSMILDGTEPTAISAPGLVSSSLTWEKVNTIDGGADLSFLDYRLNTSLDYYVRRTNGMLTKSVTLPNVLGATESNENAANLKTVGWEFKISWKDQILVAGSPLNYSITGSLADSRAWITKYANKDIWYGETYHQGMEVGEIWGLETEGFFKSNAEVASHANQTQVGSWNSGYQFYEGDLKFKNQNNDNVITRGDGTTEKPGDFKVIGNSSIRLPFSFNLTADWRGVDIQAFFQGVGKRDWYPTPDNQLFWGIYANPWANVLKQNLNHWTEETPNAYYPRLKSYSARNAWQELSCNQTKYLQNASYIRLQNLMIGYTLPSSVMQKMFIQRFRLYVSVENLFELDHLHTKMDASTLNNNANAEAIYPMSRSFSFGVNINF
jgi:TonB-linked SusC/RagA family outer membrane protein